MFISKLNSQGNGLVYSTYLGGSGNDEGEALTIQSDGKIVLGGFARFGGDNNFALVRYNSDGSIDTSFGGGDGIVLVDHGDCFRSDQPFQRGRIVLRPSGTEPVVRVMVEGEDADEVAAAAEQIAEAVRTALAED